MKKKSPMPHSAKHGNQEAQLSKKALDTQFAVFHVTWLRVVALYLALVLAGRHPTAPPRRLTHDPVLVEPLRPLLPPTGAIRKLPKARRQRRGWGGEDLAPTADTDSQNTPAVRAERALRRRRYSTIRPGRPLSTSGRRAAPAPRSTGPS